MTSQRNERSWDGFIGFANALDYMESRKDIKQRIQSAQKLEVFLDYDGTLTPIIRDPNKSFISKKMRSLVAKLSIQEKTDVAIVSGRCISKLRNFLRLDSVHLSGSHGAEIFCPATSNEPNGITMMISGSLEALKQAQQEVLGVLRSYPGCHIEDNKFVFSVHFRNGRFQLLTGRKKRVKEQELEAELKAIAMRLNLRLARGKKVFEFKPEGSWDKGVAVLKLIQLIRERDSIIKKSIWDDAMATSDEGEEESSDGNEYDGNRESLLSGPPFYIYIGDDRSDERAFAALKNKYPNQSLGILVASKPRNTEAACWLNDTEEVYNFLRLLLKDSGDCLKWKRLVDSNKHETLW
jgi:trehalose 6-phosphate phosphatase